MRETKLRFLTVPVQERFNQLVLEGQVKKKVWLFLQTMTISDLVTRVSDPDPGSGSRV
jgi:hypothetical protein